MSEALELGWIEVDGAVRKGDGLAIDGNGSLTFDQGKTAEFLFFGLAQWAYLTFLVACSCHQIDIGAWLGIITKCARKDQVNPSNDRASEQLATGRSYLSQRSTTHRTKAALDGASLALSIRMLSSSPVRAWPPAETDQSFKVS